MRVKLGLPEPVLDLSGVTSLPAHLPRRISSFSMPHRNGDAYLRDAVLDGQSFPTSKLGRRLLAATTQNPEALFELMPQALIYGFWLSHMGKKRHQTKHARAWTSEIVGFRPALVDSKALGTKGDPLNLSITDPVSYDENDQLSWAVGDGVKAGKQKPKDSLAEIGHGQVTFPESGKPGALRGISFAEIEQQASLSFAHLRHVVGATPEASAAGRALLAAIGIAGHVGAFGGSMHLRSGCDLRSVSSAWTWLGADGDQPLDVPTRADAIELVNGCAIAAERPACQLEPGGTPLRSPSFQTRTSAASSRRDPLHDHRPQRRAGLDIGNRGLQRLIRGRGGRGGRRRRRRRGGKPDGRS